MDMVVHDDSLKTASLIFISVYFPSTTEGTDFFLILIVVILSGAILFCK